jgi:hypothetical protein
MILARPHVNRFRLMDEGAYLATDTGVQSMMRERGASFAINRANARNLERFKHFAKDSVGATRLCAV